MLDTILILGLCLGSLFAVWTLGCIVLKGMFKIADKIFGL